jgi:hypothetical protein
LLKEEELLKKAELIKAELIKMAFLMEAELLAEQLLKAAELLKEAVILKEAEVLYTNLYQGKFKSERQASPKSPTLWEFILRQSHALDPLWILTLDLSRSHSGFPRILHWTPPDPILDPPKYPPKITLWIPPDLTLGNTASKPSCPSTSTAITSVRAQLHSRKLASLSPLTMGDAL